MKRSVIPIRLGSSWIVVHAGMICEFLSETLWLSVPGSTPVVPGVMTWRGRAIPVLDLPRALNLGSISPMDPAPRVAIVEHSMGTIAVPVDGAREVMTLSDEEVRPIHVSTMPYSSGEIDGPDAVLPVVEIDQILRDLTKMGSVA